MIKRSCGSLYIGDNSVVFAKNFNILVDDVNRRQIFLKAIDKLN